MTASNAGPSHADVFTCRQPVRVENARYVQILDCVYPRLRVDCILVKGEFSPAMVNYVSKRINVKVNCMFINCPKHDFKHPLDRMGGVRVILNSEKPDPFEMDAGAAPASWTSPPSGPDDQLYLPLRKFDESKDLQSSPRAANAVGIGDSS
ncbi:kdelr1 [Symbiodinium necroappetens]|uniref:Kdelr1 protein n=1 Tax=Symbiodinium necroappetens TaxID=1628268 RepID=A0A812WLI4_9DINO|nr:kdelr1 [Symbiodinium necroappetens]